MLKDLFKVETLDFRLASATGEPHPQAKASRWDTPEYYVYYLAFLTIPLLMFKSVYDISLPDHPGYAHFEHLLSDGWIPGRKVDNSDAQYRNFRDNIPYMVVLVVLHPLLRRAYEAIRQPKTSQAAVGAKGASATNAAQDAEVRMQTRISFDLGFALIFLAALHGISTLKILLIMYANFQVGTRIPKRFAGISTWVFNIAILFANELSQGYQLARIVKYVFPSQAVSPGTLFELASWLDSYGGLVARWEVTFNVAILRLIAYNFDYLWMLDRRASSPIEKKNLDPASLSERERVAIGAKPSDFTFRNYLAFNLYSPLYMIGPIINFNDYISQCRYRLPSISTARIVPYAIRFLFCLLTMELVIHHLYAVAISQARPDWSIYSPFQLSMLGYFTLHHIWLKLLIPWRFFRLWSLLDGIDPPENMVRCMSDNYSTLAFWRGWHKSFSRFIVRYIYVPLGGSGNSKVRDVCNYLAVFTFVALWHDLSFKLLTWGWLITLFVLPEVIAMILFPAKKWANSPNAYRWMCGMGGVANVLMMMVANLIGFAVGVDGVQGLVHGIVSSFEGRVFFVGACATLFVGVQVMFEWREAEKRRGINLRY